LIDVADLPAVNATLNGTATVLLSAGWLAIRAKRIRTHRNLMIAAFAASTLFLASYVTYHTLKRGVSTPFGGQGWIRPAYYAMLISHIILAAAVVPLALVTLYRAYRGRFEAHRRIARITFPIWMYVSVTGVLIYVMLYHLYPVAAQS